MRHEAAAATGSLPAPTVRPAADQLHDQRPLAVGPRLDALHLSDFPADSDADPDPDPDPDPDYMRRRSRPTLLRDTRAALARAKETRAR